MASRAFPREPSSPSCSRAEATTPPPPSSGSPPFASVQMGSRSPPSPMIGRAGNLTVFITPPSPATTPRSSRPSDSPSPDLSTPASRPSPPPPTSVSPPKKATPPSPATPVRFSPPAPPAKVSAPPVRAPPPQYGKAGKHDDGSAFGFLWDAVARVQEAHASLDEYVANWFGLDQSKYQWALNDYYETTGKEVEPVKAGKPKELTTTTNVQKV